MQWTVKRFGNSEFDLTPEIVSYRIQQQLNVLFSWICGSWSVSRFQEDPFGHFMKVLLGCQKPFFKIGIIWADGEDTTFSARLMRGAGPSGPACRPAPCRAGGSLASKPSRHGNARATPPAKKCSRRFNFRFCPREIAQVKLVNEAEERK